MQRAFFLTLMAMLAMTVRVESSEPWPSQEIAPIIARFEQEIPRRMAQDGVPGLALAVIDHQRIIWAAGYGITKDRGGAPVTGNTLFSIQSSSKALMATAILLAVQDGLLDLDEPITTYLPGFTVNSRFEEDAASRMTLRHLLSHTAGFTHEAPVGNNFDLGPVSFADHVASVSSTWLRYPVERLRSSQDPVERLRSSHDPVERLRSSPEPVGQRYSYSNLGIDLAGWILQQVSGVPFERWVE